jgi:prephenate dehydrogenase
VIKYNNILIIGLGMMGASLCKSIKKNKISKKVIGFDTNSKTLDYALKNKLVDNAISKINDIDHPDLIILCTPISSYEELALKLTKVVIKKSILTDIGSSKGNMHNNIYKILSKTKINYLSSHPMVGSEKSGVRNYQLNMYKDKIIFLIDRTKCSNSTYKSLNNFWKSLGSHTYNLTKNQHDTLMSQTSHISHLMSYIFMQSLPQSIINNNLSLLLGGGIKEHVRLSKSDPKMWTDIFINNKSNLIKSINRIEKNISNLKKMISESDANKIQYFLSKIQAKTK